MHEYSIMNGFSLDANFWDHNEHFLLIPEFKKLYKKDRSKDKKNSSKLMWAIALLVHPKSKFSELDTDTRTEIISADYFPNEDWVSENQELIDIFKKYSLTRNQRIAKEWGDKLDERTEFLMRTPYNLDNAEKLDATMARTEKIWNVYQKCLADLQEEESKGRVQGGGIESASEENRI